MEPIQPIINDQTIEIEHPQHGLAHCDRSTLAEWTGLGWKPRGKTKGKKTDKPEATDASAQSDLNPPADA